MSFIKKILPSLFFLFFCATSFAQTLQRIEIKQHPTQTLLILTLKNTTTPSFLVLPNPDRLIIDLPNTKPSSAIPTAISSDGLIKKIRLGNGPYGPGNMRLVMDLAKPVDYVYLNDINKNTNAQTITLILKPKTIVPSGVALLQEEKLPDVEAVDLEELTQEPESNKAQANVPPVPPKSEQKDVIQTTIQKMISINQASLKKVVVVIDPGHGGKDCGALGPDRVMEKTVVLAIAKKLQNVLNQGPGMDARLTRHGDYFISLRQRLNIARHDRAQIFVAVHADAFNDSARGASVFALSAHGATSEMARWLAARENTSELCGIDLKVKDRALKSVLLDMSQTATVQDSLQLGASILSSLKRLTILHADQVEQAGFVVLKSPDIPSVLVETGFVSNPKEAARLVDADYQQQMAEAIAHGVQHYFAENPPPGSWFEMQYKN